MVEEAHQHTGILPWQKGPENRNPAVGSPLEGRLARVHLEMLVDGRLTPLALALDLQSPQMGQNTRDDDAGELLRLVHVSRV